LFENIFIARALSKDDLPVDPFELASIAFAMEADDSEDCLDRGGSDEDWLREDGGWLSPLWDEETREAAVTLSLGREKDLLRRGLGILERPSMCS
jgi:hypothetical protein